MTAGEPGVPPDRIVAFFDRRARGYDLQVPLERRALRAAAEMAEPLPGARVVDLAAGTGALAQAIVGRCRSLSALTLVDAAPRMLERAHRRLGAAGVPPRFLVADVRAVPLPDDCADVVSIGYLLHLLDPGQRAPILHEARRLLRPGGRLVVVVHGVPRGRGSGVYRSTWRIMRRIAPRGVLGHGPMDDAVGPVEAAGFEVTESRRLRGVYWSQIVAARPATPEGSGRAGGAG